MKRIWLRVVVYAVMVALAVGGVGIAGYMKSYGEFWGSIRTQPAPSLEGLEKPAHDPGKPTVAVLLGNATTEGLDFTIPYQIFGMTGAYNVYAVAQDNGVRSLTGGVDVVPHYSFEELDALLGGGPDIIAIPYMTQIKDRSFDPIREWIVKHRQATLLSICAGAEMFASTGLLDGKVGATHWQTMSMISKLYPNVDWVEGKRYVTNENGRWVSSAGISSGIDATLYVVSRDLGEPAAKAAAEELRYPSYHFVNDPNVEPFRMDFRFSTYLLNNMFHWNKTDIGAMLYDGVEEMAVASVFDIYSDSGTTRVHSIAMTDGPVTTKYGLRLLARNTVENAPAVDKTIVPGRDARTLARDIAQAWTQRGNEEPMYVHADAPERFLFQAQLEDLAEQEDLMTARHAVKRLEFRATDFELRGFPFPLETYAALLATLVGAVLLARLIDRKWVAKPKRGGAARGSERRAA